MDRKKTSDTEAFRELEADPVWLIAGSGKRPEPAPGFTGRVLDRIHSLEARESPMTRFLRRTAWLFRPATAALAALLLFFFAAVALQILPLDQPAAPATVRAETDYDPADFEVLLDLDILLAYDETLLWTDASPF